MAVKKTETEKDLETKDVAKDTPSGEVATSTPPKQKEVDYDKRIRIRSVVNFPIGFKRLLSQGDVTIPPNGIDNLITVAEVVNQCQRGNTLFTGIDGKGSHARIYIEDKDTRVLVGFEDETGAVVQKMLDESTLAEMFKLTKITEFKKMLTEYCVTEADKINIMEYARKINCNEANKIKLVEEFTGKKFE